MQKSAQKNCKDRVQYWDSIKGLLIFLVVIGHFLWGFRDQGYSKYIVEFIYFFHMPAFIFVAGYFSKKKDSVAKDSLLKLFILYILFNTALMFFSFIVDGTPPQLITPYYSAWFLLSLTLWRLTIKYFPNLPNLFLLSLLVSILIGFWGSVTNIFAISRTITFFPFFILGFKFSEKQANHLIYNRKLKDFLIGILILILTCLLLVFLINNNPGISEENFLMDAYTSRLDIFFRIIIFCLSGLMIVSLLFLTPQKTIPLLTKWGKNSLSIYVFHRFITIIFSKVFLAINYTEHYIGYAILASIMTVLFLGSDFVSKTLNSVVDTILSRLISLKKIMIGNKSVN